jgi:hypothetical protein
MARQQVMQLLPLPRELIRLIKDYTFPYKDYILARRQYNLILDIIKGTPYKGNISPDRLWFWSENVRDEQFQIDFCTVCGNYRDYMNTNVPCTC